MPHATVHRTRTHLAPLLAIAAGVLASSVGCSHRAGLESAQSPARDASARTTAQSLGTEPVALLDGHEISWSDIRAGTIEVGAGLALREAVLDRLLTRALRERAVEVTPDDLAVERRMLVETMSRASAAAPEASDQLLEMVRRARGLSTTRMDALLWRTAALRRLVAGSIEITPEEIAREHERRHGARHRARVLVVRDAARAQELRQLLTETPPSEREARFGDLAIRESIDGSASLGGQLEAISAADVTFADAIRRALPSLGTLDVSPLIPLNGGYALLLAQGHLPPDGVSLEAASADALRDLRLARERVAMDDLARQLLHDARITILSREAKESWDLIESMQRPR